MVRLLAVTFSGLAFTGKLAAALPALSLPHLGLFPTSGADYDVETDFMTQTLTNLKTVYRSKLPSSLATPGATSMLTSTVTIAGFPMTVVRPLTPTTSATSAIPVVLGTKLSKTTVTVTSDATAYIIGATSTPTGHPILQLGSATLFNDPLNLDNVIIGAETLVPGAEAKTVAGSVVSAIGGNSLVVGPAALPMPDIPSGLPLPSASFGFQQSTPALTTIQIPTGSPLNVLSFSSLPIPSLQAPTITASVPIIPAPQLSVVVPTLTVSIPVITAAPSDAQVLSPAPNPVSIEDPGVVASALPTSPLTIVQSVLDGSSNTFAAASELSALGSPSGLVGPAIDTQFLTVTQSILGSNDGLASLTQLATGLTSSVTIGNPVIPNVQTSLVSDASKLTAIPGTIQLSTSSLLPTLGPSLPSTAQSSSAAMSSANPTQGTTTKSCQSNGKTFQDGQQYTSSNRQEYTVRCSQDNSQPAFTVFGVSSGGFQRCFDACDATPQCQGWTYSGADSGNCYLKAGEGSYFPASSTIISSFKASSGSPPSGASGSSDSAVSSSQASQTATSAGSAGAAGGRTRGDCHSLAHQGTQFTSTKGTSYELACRHDIGGNDLAAVSSPTFKGCFTACDLNPDCAAFSWLQDEGPGTCYLKSALNGQPIPSHADLAIKSDFPGSKGVSSDIPAQQSPTSASTEPSSPAFMGRSCREIGTSNNFATPNNNYTVACRIDYAGGDLSNAPSMSFSDCFERCDMTTGCVGVSYLGGSGPGTCYFKSSLSRASYNPNVDSGALARPRASPSISSGTTPSVTSGSLTSTVSISASTPISTSSSVSSKAPSSSVTSSISSAVTTPRQSTQIVTVTVTGSGSSLSSQSSLSADVSSHLTSTTADQPKATSTMTIFTTPRSPAQSSHTDSASSHVTSTLTDDLSPTGTKTVITTPSQKPSAIPMTQAMATTNPSNARITGLTYEGSGNPFIAVKQVPSGASLMDGALTASLRPGQGMYFDGHFVNIAPQNDGLVIDAKTFTYTTYANGAGPVWATPTIVPSPVAMESIVHTTMLTAVTDDRGNVKTTSVVAPAGVVTITSAPTAQQASSTTGYIGTSAVPVKGIKNPTPPAGVNNRTQCDFLVHREPFYLKTHYIKGLGNFFTGGVAGMDNLYLAAPPEPNQVNIPQLTPTTQHAAPVLFNSFSGTIAVHTGDACDFVGLSLTDYYWRTKDQNFGSRALWVPGLATGGFLWDNKSLLRDKLGFFNHWLACKVPDGKTELHWKPKTFSLVSPVTWFNEKIDYGRCAKVYLKPVRARGS